MNFSKRKHILIVSAVFPPEPVTSATLNYDLATELAKVYEVTVLKPRPSRPTGFDFSQLDKKSGSNNFKEIILDSYIHPASSFYGRMKESRSFGHACVKYINLHKEEIDFVYNDGWQFFSLNIVAKACVKHNIPYIVPIQDIYPESIITKIPNILGSHFLVKYLLGDYDRYYQEHATAVRTITDSMADYLSGTRKVSRKKYIVVANWQNDEEFDDYKTTFRKNGKTVFMFVGNNNKQANVELMIRAYHEANLENAEFYIMGGGNAKQDCMDLVKELGHGDIKFDVVPKGMVAKVQKEADVMVLALRKGTGIQGVPSKLTAYMLSGKPIIASMDKGADAAKMILSAKAGVWTKAEDVEAFSNSFRLMANVSTESLEEMGNNSRRYAEERLSRMANLEKVVKEINKILQ